MNILGVRIDEVNLDQAVDRVEAWLSKKGKHYIVTPNVEFVMAARQDEEFKKVLNGSDLAVPDSARLGWAHKVLTAGSLHQKLLFWPLFLFPRLADPRFPVTTGTDLMEALIKLCAREGYSVGFIGGRKHIAERLAKKLKKRYPSLNITFASSDIEINYEGDVVSPSQTTNYKLPTTNLLFVAFGHVKQEKWICKNLATQNVKIMIGVGGAFDYLTGDIPRAPALIRFLGFEWLFRFFMQPSRIKRFGPLLKFVVSLRSDNNSKFKKT